ncbi:MAG: hypothetical protein M1830_000539, partial [Pleopsidium flavum]
RSAVKPKITISKFALSVDQGKDETAYEARGTAKARKSDREVTSRSVSKTLSGFARKSWISGSRSPSPGTRSGQDIVQDGATLDVQAKGLSISSPKLSQVDKTEEKGEVARSPSRRGTVSSKKTRRPLSAFLQKSTAETTLPRSPSLTSLRKSLSGDKLRSLDKSLPSSERIPPMPRSMSTERLQSIGFDTSKRKDELWSAFRALDGDFQKFKSKSSALKANIVRSSLLPFLRSYAHHQSNKVLRPEDLDRRINILNKWWTGLLEVLNGRNNQTISGTDRPILLEGMAGIMVRPEWRLPPSPFASSFDRLQHIPLKSRSTTSLESTASEFLTESIHHNVRNMFVQNLLAQMAFVVDRMSLRNAAASLVAFCGKAAAYAFFFCPGVADILVRLWATPFDKLRHVLEEYGIPRNTDLRSSSNATVSEFPPCLHPLAFTSLRSTKTYLRRQPPLPLGAASIPWHGHWLARWCGRDSDLFFVFTKYYHILLSEFSSADTGRQERVCAPGLIMVHAQILTLLDSTIHRQTGQPPSSIPHSPSSVTFDDMLAGPDASAAALPLPPASVIRSMSENRLIILLRDFLSEQSSDFDSARRTFAEAFSDLLKAAARRTSLFDHNACFTLCDLMEEAVAILARYHHATDSLSSLLDWSFWLDVSKLMVASQNSMTKIRLFAFLYGVWKIITTDEQRKRDLCLGWLLNEDCFLEHFNHWCPMVRAYFMRLLCWRLGRYDGEASELDIHLAPDGMFLPLEVVVPPSSSTQPTAYERYSSLDTLSLFDRRSSSGKGPSTISSDSEISSSAGKKRWGLLKNMIPFSTPGGDRARIKSVSHPSTQDDADQTRSNLSSYADTTIKDGQTSDGSPNELSGIDEVPNGVTHTALHHRKFSFRFSLEWMERPHNFGKDRRLYHPRLPTPAQTYLQSTRAETFESTPRKPAGLAISCSRYAGRALAEWTLTVIECQNFFERRKSEGVPGNKWVETPTLGVDSFRKIG